MNALVRRLRQTARVGYGARCERCDYDRIEALVSGNPVLCARCDARERDVADIELHHVAGRANDPFVLAKDTNDHREMTAMQRSWPLQTLRNPTGSEHLRIAAMFRGLADEYVFAADYFEWQHPNPVAEERVQMPDMLRGLAELFVWSARWFEWLHDIGGTP